MANDTHTDNDKAGNALMTAMEMRAVDLESLGRLASACRWGTDVPSTILESQRQIVKDTMVPRLLAAVSLLEAFPQELESEVLTELTMCKMWYQTKQWCLVLDPSCFQQIRSVCSTKSIIVPNQHTMTDLAADIVLNCVKKQEQPRCMCLDSWDAAPRSRAAPGPLWDAPIMSLLIDLELSLERLLTSQSIADIVGAHLAVYRIAGTEGGASFLYSRYLPAHVHKEISAGVSASCMKGKLCAIFRHLEQYYIPKHSLRLIREYIEDQMLC